MHRRQFPFPSAACALGAVAVVLLAAWGPAPQRFERVPFANFLIDGRAYPIVEAGDVMAIQGMDGRTVALPAAQVPLAGVRLSDASALVFTRKRISGDFAASVVRHGAATALRIDGPWAQRLLFHHAITWGDSVIVVAYDVEATTPSGRTVGQQRDGLSVFIARMSGDAVQLTPLAEVIPLGGIDPQERGVLFNGAPIVCGVSACAFFTHDAAGAPSMRLRANVGGQDRELLALAGDDAAVWALYRVNADDRFTPPPAPRAPLYWLCRVDQEAPCEAASVGQTPRTLRVRDGRPQLEAINLARASARERTRLLRDDLTALPLSGLTYYAVNNREGRIPWGQVYLLEGLADAVEVAGHLGDNALARDARTRLGMEVRALAALCRPDDPGLSSRRYSVARQEIYTMVHLGLVAHVAARAEQLVGSEALGRNFDCLRSFVNSELDTPNRAMERVVRDVNGPPHLRIRRNVPFWSDGVNSPWNYQSAYITGMLSPWSNPPSEARKTLARDMLRHFISIEGIEQNSNITLWNYGYGRFLDGWTEADNISTNTPTWAGDRKLATITAHISYRSMDAGALLAAQARADLNLQPSTLARLSALIESGWLWPGLIGRARMAGLDPHLAPQVADRYARSVNTWDVQNQVWALERGNAR